MTRVADRFRLEDAPHAEGASGVVWGALDETTGRRVAVKLLHPHLLDRPDALERVLTEAGVATRIEHPHVVRVVGVWRHEEGVALVSDWVDGTPLSAADAMSARGVREIGRAVASALARAHAIGVVHGDVRPANVLVGDRTWLYDFGAAALGDAAPRRPWETAPEVLAGGPSTVRSDLFGLGLVMYRALTGRAAFDGPPKAAPKRPKGPRWLTDLVLGLLEIEPSRRPASADEVLDALERRRLGWATHGIAPLRPGSAWMVYGNDPSTGGRVRFAEGLSKPAARDLARRLSERGWHVRPVRVALGGIDLATILVGAVAGSIVFPALGPLVALGVAWALSARCRTDLRDTLPSATTPLPPRELPQNAELHVLGGLLLLTTAVLLVAWPAAAAVPGALVLVVVIAAARPLADPRHPLLTARVELRLAELRRSAHRRPLDAELALLGSVDEVEQSWRSGESVESVLRRLDTLESGRNDEVP